MFASVHPCIYIHLSMQICVNECIYIYVCIVAHMYLCIHACIIDTLVDNARVALPQQHAFEDRSAGTRH